MPILVKASPRAQQQIHGLRTKDRRRFDQFIQELAASGCAALSYRITGPEPLELLCVKHLVGDLRVVVGFVSDTAWILLVGRHRAEPGVDVYAALYDLAGLTPPPADDGRTKPSCCDEQSGQPPTFDVEALEDLVTRARELRRSRGRDR